MFVKLITFKAMMFLGYITPMNDSPEGVDMYLLNLPNGTVIEYAYKAEILEYIKTGVFEYDDTLEESVDFDYDPWTAVEEWEEDRD